MVTEDKVALETAVTYYAANGFAITSLPVVVPEYDIMITCPDIRYATVAAPHLGQFVGSAEQSFLHFDRIGKLGKGAFVAHTECWRNEHILDKWHQAKFRKVELYNNVFETPEADLERMIQLAEYFFNHLDKSSLQNSQIRKVDIVTTDIGYDIEYHGIELGSYGIRTHVESKLNWVYGTGLAEPRFSSVLKEFEK